MKKTLLLLASAAMLLVGCQKENFVEQQDGKLVDATFTASLESGVATRAAVDGDGAAASVNRCIMEIYYGDELFTRQYAPVNGQKKATFTVQVVSNRTYTVAFWADCVESPEALATDKYYITNAEGGLKAITINGSYAGNDDARDAFYHVGQYTVAQAGSSFGGGENDKILLKRPFAQMNVITTDWDKASSATGLAPEKVDVTIKNALISFNAVTEQASGSKTLNYQAAVYTPAASGTNSEVKTLSMDYLFASKDKAVIDIDWKALHGADANVAHTFAAVPYQRNYRTNIKGALLTTQGQWTVTVDSDWDGNGTTVEGGNDPYLVNYFAAGSIAAANKALKTNNAVSIENPNDLGADIVIPAEQNGESVYIKVSGASSGNIAVKASDTDNGPASLAIESDSKTLNIDLPNSHVDVNNGVNYTSITAKTGDNTLVIGKDVVAAALDVQKGSVEIHGKVDSLNRAAGISAKFYASDGTTLANYVTWAKAGETVELECDIDLAGTTWNSPELNADFNGNGHIIKNIKNLACAPDYAGLFKISYSNIKNVTIQNAEFAYDNSSKAARGGALVGDMRRGSIENCHVDGIKFDGYQKVGGLVGFLSKNADNGTDISIKNCSVKNATFAACGADDEYLYQTGGLIGYIQLGNRNISISNCSVDHITFDNTKYNGVYDEANTNDGYLSHTFVGAIFSDTNNAENTLSFTANTISTTSGENTPLKANMYGSAYFGWARNPEFGTETVTLGKITIDGEEWTPNYPFKIVGGKAYATLAAALSAATSGQTVQILKAGKYTFPGNTKKAIIVEGLDEKDADGNYVVAINLNGVSEYNENLTFKHLTFNFTNSEGNDRGFTHCVNMTYNECAFTGLMWGYDSQVSTFNDCLFHQATKYNVWSYGGNLEFNRCLFQTSTGTIVNVYATGTDVHEVRFNDCTFESLNDVLDKGAILLKGGNNHGHVIVNNYTLKGKFQNNGDSAKYINSADGLYMFSLRDGDFCDAVYITVNGVTHYPYFTIDANGNYSVNSANGLKKAIAHWNKLASAGEKTITVANGTYEVSDMVIAQNVSGKSLTIKAATAKGVTLKIPATPLYPYMFMVNGCSSYDETRAITFNGFKFDVSAITDKSVAPVMNMSSKEDYSNLGYPMASTGHANDYGGYITIDNCELIGGNGSRNDNAAMYLANSGASPKNITVQNSTLAYAGYLLATYVNGFTAKNVVTTTPIKHFINNQTGGVTVDGCTVECNTDYAVRSSAGPVSITNSAFTMTYTGTGTGGIYVDRGANTQVTMSGNTYPASYAGANMHDVYNEKGGVCTISNGSETIATLNNGESYDFPRQ